ncbi:MAG: BREX-1 system phosphatase PglZ type A [Defluviitaleaceae bacterium]|nr:BREX-1 system phosphatase PglZ type A [Defluviitaleaceae bacterium]
MNLTELKKSLGQQFAQDFSRGSKRNIIFWYDENAVFEDFIDDLSLDNAKTIKLCDNNMFATKLYIEETDPGSNLLVYSPQKRPANSDNWLADTIKYSQIFSADLTSLNLVNLGVDNALRGVIAKYEKFFTSIQRTQKFQSYPLATCSEDEIHIGVLSALCKLQAPSLDNAVKTLLAEMINNENTIYESIEKFGSMEIFWSLINKTYGYDFPDQSLEKLAILLLCSHLSHSVKLDFSAQAYVSGNPNCFVFADNLMRNSQFSEDYNKLAVFVADKLKLADHVSKWTIDDVVDCDTFEDFDKYIIARIRENINHKAGEYGYYRKIINSRKNRRFYPHFQAQYETLLHACDYLDLATHHKDIMSKSTHELFEAYVKTYYKFDASYRHFVAAYDRLECKDDFSEIFEMLENSYTNRFLNELSMKWSALLDETNTWKTPGITAQQRFYNRHVGHFVRDNERVVVIISDGLRYESAQELNEIINREQKGVAELDVMLGAVPSTTSLGMAALLPHSQIDITEKGEFEIKGISTEGTENRGKILQLEKKDSIALRYKNIVNLNQQQLSEALSASKLIYIYHNTIDSVGDKETSENEVFEATQKAFRELSNLVRNLRNLSISVLNIIITADHGYIYRRTPLQEYDKTPKQDLAGVIGGRRFLLTKGDIERQGTHNFPMSYLTQNHNDIFAIIPRSTNCFKLQGGGSRYVHGGATLQEVVIPVIKFRSDKNAKQSMGATKVKVGLTNLSRKITRFITHLSFFQNELVDEKHLPITITAYFADEAGNRISNENIIIADSRSKKPEDRVYKEKFTLKDMAYKKDASYYLVLKDEREVELERIPFEIDLVNGGGMQLT